MSHSRSWTLNVYRDAAVDDSWTIPAGPVSRVLPAMLKRYIAHSWSIVTECVLPKWEEKVEKS